MDAGRSYRIGDVALDPRVVNERSVREFSEASRLLKLEGTSEVGEILDGWHETRSLASEEFAAVNEFSGQALAAKKELQREWWDLGGPREGERTPEQRRRFREVESDLADLRVFLGKHGQVRDNLRVEGARAAVQALAGASFAPIGTVAAYAAWASLSQTATAELVETLGPLREGASPMLHEGNLVAQKHREDLWVSMNDLLDEAIAKGQAGEPVEVDGQYYEFTSDEIIGKMARAAQAGNKVRLNLDPAFRLTFPDRDGSYDVSNLPGKLRSVLQLTAVDGDVGVTLYPTAEKLGRSDLMHRKLLRVGDRVLLSGMNANNGSGENIDAGYEIQGPAARALVANLRRDVEASLGAGMDQLYGKKAMEDLQAATLVMGPWGLSAMLDNVSGPSPAGTELRVAGSAQELKDQAKAAGVELGELLELDGRTLDEALARLFEQNQALPLSGTGKELLADQIRRAVEATQDEGNVARAGDISEASDRKAGKTVVAVADQPAEREAAMLHAIQEAQEFIYLPGFVVTRAVASALVARRAELEAEGRQLDVKVIADPGVYPYGGTPNSWGVKFLEDHGLTPRWALLPRTNHHDRKVHAKQLITDRHEMFGSTNFSNKAMRENSEQSALVAFDPGDPSAMADRNRSAEQFLDTWENESFELSSLDLAGAWKRRVTSKDKAEQIEEARDSAIGKIIQQIEKVEKESALWMQAQAQEPSVAERVERNRKNGMSEGYAILQAVKEELGAEHFHRQLADLPARRELERMKPRRPSGPDAF